MNTSEFESLPLELKLQILSGLSYSEIQRYCVSGKASLSLCRDPYLWYLKVKGISNISYEEFIETNLSPVDRYLELKYLNRFPDTDCVSSDYNALSCLKTILGYEDYHLFRLGMQERLPDVDEDLLIYLLKYNPYIDINAVLRIASTIGRFEYVDWALKRGADDFTILAFSTFYLNDIDKLETLYRVLYPYISKKRELHGMVLESLIDRLARAGYIEPLKYFLRIGLPSIYGDEGENLLTISALNTARLTAAWEESTVGVPYRQNLYRDIQRLLDEHINYLKNAHSNNLRR